MKFSNIRLSAFIATSVDGFIARHNGKLDWLEIASNKNSPDDFGYHDYIGSVDCVVMGRNSFEKAVSFPEWPYHNKRVIVLSRRWKYIPDQFAHLAEHYSGKVELLTVELQNQGARHVYVDGGVTIQSFIQQKLLTEMTLNQLPILLGAGVPLFGMTRGDQHLELISSRSFDSGVVQSKYAFVQ